MQRVEPLHLPLKEKCEFFLVNLSNIQQEEVDAASKVVDDISLARAERFSFERDRNRLLIAQAILRQKLGELLNCKPSEVTILRDDFGKPYIEGHLLHFSLSYSHHYALFAFCPDRLIGVDIEAINPDRVVLESPVLHEIEKNQIISGEDPIDSFYDYWCAKEALLKAMGTGFTEEKPPLLTHVSYGVFSSEKPNAIVYTFTTHHHKIGVCLLEEE
ncbi:4'-phosphopantetheinyl transferase family protein [Simkania negevensis]|uniref:Uncharacterized protein n=1 Tax=Simkania negevensis (strain ATCC VR-1471 / DSM 27360 / Z) TaxID=331113 RepID=F8L503_SIMNZ|nr:4'-phosphopantetheinyl transferase superfamily protein [Simkania negevensis]CCB87884.1 hypothetical protein SNE_A00060 [Simkania negevensis Z]